MTVCGTTGGNPTLVIPSGKKFFIKAVSFRGPCKSSSIHVQIQGTIIGPSQVQKGVGYYMNSWIVFQRVNGLTVDGNGVIDGQGANWWKCFVGRKALKFDYSNNLRLSGLKLVNAPMKFISLSKCHNSVISNIDISAPGDSPNTDGIDITNSDNVAVSNCNIASGQGYARRITFENITVTDTQVPIILDQFYCPEGGCANQTKAVKVSDVSFINIRGTTSSEKAMTILCSDTSACTNVKLEHIKITSSSGKPVVSHCNNIQGTMDPYGEYDTRRDVLIQDCTFSNIRNLPRIRSQQGGVCYATETTFENITFTDTRVPIIVDQCYCPQRNCINQTNAHQRNIGGTTSSEKAMAMLRSDTSACTCTSVKLERIKLTPSSGKPIVSQYNNEELNAFEKAWKAVCGSTGGNPTLVIPSGKKFLIRAVSFPGPCKSPSIHVQVLKFDYSNNLRLSDLKLVNAPMKFISLSKCHNSVISDIVISAPGDSPNTDGIDITNSNNVTVSNSNIASGQGYARKITFQNITVTDVQVPIILDQFYCPEGGCANQTKAVKISDISFIDIRGTTSSEKAMTILCSDTSPCTNVRLEHINITSASGKPIVSQTHNVRGKFVDITPKL
ncbi:hypothetical protein Tsubulata_040885 [Turnera subulata]|uniref:Polygalacturonase n=1 Tax=Turnera subulata TaxID=218843 RepID=A0A9Q0GBY1_9ROSI|nr:hypothetical protein Tsubulata_040885 [Turnera subulata]